MRKKTIANIVFVLVLALVLLLVGEFSYFSSRVNAGFYFILALSAYNLGQYVQKKFPN